MSQIAFVFPGQGAQTVGMGRELAAAYPAAAEMFERANELLGYDLRKICWEGPADELNTTVVSQPALFVTSLAALEKLRAEQPEAVAACQATCGLSLGEYTALVFAGVMSFEEGLRVVQRRGEAMQAAADATPSGMVSLLGLEPEKVEQLCDEARAEDGVLRVANLLCPGNIVVSGGRDECERVAELAEAAGAMKTIPLAVAGAFHTPIMDSAVEQLAAALEGVTMHPPTITFVSNVDAMPHEDPEEIRQLLVRQVVSPVRWEDSMRLLLEKGCDQFFEVGPGRVLRGLLKRIHRKVPCQGVLE